MIFTIILGFFVAYGPSRLRNHLGTEGYVILWIVFVFFGVLVILFLMVLFLRCRSKYIPRLLNGARKRMEQVDVSLPTILNWTYQFVPGENRLVEIEKDSRLNLAHLDSAIQEQFGFLSSDILLAGSTAERFNVPLTPGEAFSYDGISDTSHAVITDFDFMISPATDVVSFSRGQRYLVNMSEEELQPGYAYMFDEESKLLSAKHVKKNLLKVVKTLRIRFFNGFVPVEEICLCCTVRHGNRNSAAVKIKGPAIEMRLSSTPTRTDRFLADVIFALKCKDWPGIVSNWTSRPGKKWPAPHEITRITEVGCHFVPKSQLDDKDEDTWRISFSAAEVELSKLIPSVARMCFIGLKIIRKDYLSIACGRLASYHLKSIFFYTLERTGAEFWLDDERRIEECFHLLLHNLTQSVYEKRCPHFWIPAINLFSEFTEKDTQCLLKVLQKIKQAPARYIEPFMFECDEGAVLTTPPIQEQQIDRPFELLQE